MSRRIFKSTKKTSMMDCSITREKIVKNKWISFFLTRARSISNDVRTGILEAKGLWYYKEQKKGVIT